jgi:hypothetical protein
MTHAISRRWKGAAGNSRSILKFVMIRMTDMQLFCQQVNGNPRSSLSVQLIL